MKFLNNFMDFLSKFADKGTMTEKNIGMIIVYAAVILAACFLIFAVSAVFGGGKFISVAKKATKKLKAEDNEGFKLAMQKLPTAQKISWESYRKNRAGVPSASFPADTCLNAGFKTSIIAAAPVVMAFLTFLVSMLVVALCAVGYTVVVEKSAVIAIGIVVFVGAFLTLLTYIIAKVKYACCVKAYSIFCATIDARFTKSEKRAESYQETVAYEESVQVEAEPVVVNYNQPVQEDVVEQVVIINEDRAEEDARENEQRQRAMEERRQQEEARERVQEEARARAAQRQQQVAVEAEPIVVVTPQTSEPVQAEPVPASQAAPNPEDMDIVERIDRMLEEGASPVQIKEVARLLQIERAKPENKTPEQTRRLNDALAKLVKAMSSAPRK